MYVCALRVLLRLEDESWGTRPNGYGSRARAFEPGVPLSGALNLGVQRIGSTCMPLPHKSGTTVHQLGHH